MRVLGTPTERVQRMHRQLREPRLLVVPRSFDTHPSACRQLSRKGPPKPGSDTRFRWAHCCLSFGAAGNDRFRLLPWVAAGFAAGVLLGVLYVLIAWFPDAMASFADNRQFVDPRNVLMGWSGTFGTVSGLVGALIGLGLGAVSSGRESLRGRGSRGPDV